MHFNWVISLFYLIRYKIILGRILCDFLPEFKFLKDLVPDHTPCLYEDEMSSRSLVVPFPVMMKDEKKYSDLVDVLDKLEVWLHDLYAKAGLCSPLESSSTQSCQPIQEGVSARPGQPQSHVPPTRSVSDPLPAVPCYGDQLTRVRLAGAKDLRAGCHTARDRFDHLYPVRIVDWHSKRSLLKVQYICDSLTHSITTT